MELNCIGQLRFLNNILIKNNYLHHISSIFIPLVPCQHSLPQLFRLHHQIYNNQFWTQLGPEMCKNYRYFKRFAFLVTYIT